MRALGLALSLGSVFLLSESNAAQDDNLQERINRAIDRGVEFLRKSQRADGSWEDCQEGGKLFSGAVSALVGYTLLESGVSKDDPAVQKAAEVVRRHVLSEDFAYTYSISLALLFLEKLGHPPDDLLIEVLALRLVDSQSRHGFWKYTCEWAELDPKVLTVEDQRRRALYRIQETSTKKDPASGKAAIGPKRKATPAIFAALQNLNSKGAPRFYDGGDGSNAQFALIALWAARRHGLPVEGALLGGEHYFRTYSLPGGHWSYWKPQGGSGHEHHSPRPSMTGVALLSFALAHGVRVKGGKGKDLLLTDEAVKAGLANLGALLEKPAGTALPNTRDHYYLYFLWTLERVCVLYDVKTLGQRDWYRWGASYLVERQKENGAWEGEPTLADTCFALLFLKRANIAPELTDTPKLIARDPPPTKKPLPEDLIFGPGLVPKDKEPAPKKALPEKSLPARRPPTCCAPRR